MSKVNEALKIATQNPSKLTKAQQQLLIKNGLDDFVRGGKTQSPMGDLAILGLTGAAVKNPLKALEVIGTDPNDHRELSLEAAMQKSAMSALNPLSKIKRLGRGVSRTWDAVNTALRPRQLATVTPGANPLKISSNPQQALQPLSIRGQGTSKQLLDIEAQNAAEALKAKNAKDTSTISSVTSDPSDPQWYGKNTKAIKAQIPKELGGKRGTITEIKGVPSKQFHHIFLKDLSAEYVKRARSLVTEGKATPDDVIMLDRIAKKYGFGLGNYKTAGDYIDKIPHNLGHDSVIKKGIQPSSKGNKIIEEGPGPDLETTKLKISKHKDIKSLLEDFEDSIKEVAVPIREEISSFQEAWDKIPSVERGKLIELRLQRKAARLKYQTPKTGTKVIKVQHPELVKAEEAYSKLKSKLQKDVLNIKENIKESRLQIKDQRIEENLRQRIPEEMWTSKGR